MKEFSQPDDGAPYNALAPKDDSLDRIWALVDSNRKLHEPASDFPDDPVFVIQASSPRPMCHEWVRGGSTPDVLFENMALSRRWTPILINPRNHRNRGHGYHHNDAKETLG